MEFFHKKCKRNFRILRISLFSRYEEKLQKLANGIHILIDFLVSHTKPSVFFTTKNKNINKFKIGNILVNNVGLINPNESPEYFTKIQDLYQFIGNIIKVNISTCTRLSIYFIQGSNS